MHRPRNVIYDVEKKSGYEHGEISGKLVTLDLPLHLIQNVIKRSLVWQIQLPSEAIKVFLEIVKKGTQEKQELLKIH